MKKDIKQLSKEIVDYLAKFKDEDGEGPNPVHVGLMIHDYCDLYIDSRKK
jgi:hypothetical protein